LKLILGYLCREWDNIWATNKRIIDPTSHRYVAVANEAANGGAVPFVLSNFSGADSKQTPLLPKNPDAGTRELQLAARVLLERDDVKLLKEGEEITLMRWGNAIVERIEKDANGNAVAVHGRLNLEGDFSKTERKITFVAERADCTKLQFIEVHFSLR
jgi:glutamyl-tRNA synthetase